MAGIFILILGSALCGSSQNVEQLIAFRVIQGLGAGMIMGIAFAILGDVFTPAERGRWAGLMSGVFASASVLGPLIGGTLTDHVHWRWVFYVNLPLGAIALTVLALGMPNIRPPKGSKLDYRGVVLLLATVSPMLLAFSWAGSRYDWVSPQVIGLLAWAAVGFIVFTIAELRTEEPLIPMALFRNRIFTVAALVTLISGVAMMGSFFYIPLFVQGVIGASATNSGIVLIPMMVSMAIASAISGQLMSRLGRYRIQGIVGLGLMVVGADLALAVGCELDATRCDLRDDPLRHRPRDFDAAVHAGGAERGAVSVHGGIDIDDAVPALGRRNVWCRDHVLAHPERLSQPPGHGGAPASARQPADPRGARRSAVHPESAGL